MTEQSPQAKPESNGTVWIALVVIVAGIFFGGVYVLSHNGPSGYPVGSDTSYQASAEQLVRQRLRDPDSAEFTAVRVIDNREGTGKVACGMVNAKNGFGGMTGAKRFIAGGVVAIEDDIGTAGMDQLWARFCRSPSWRRPHPCGNSIGIYAPQARFT